MEVRINKEVRDYQESLFFGLALRPGRLPLRSGWLFTYNDMTFEKLLLAVIRWSLQYS